jgi:hypothetical protein
MCGNFGKRYPVIRLKTDCNDTTSLAVAGVRRIHSCVTAPPPGTVWRPAGATCDTTDYPLLTTDYLPKERNGS